MKHFIHILEALVVVLFILLTPNAPAATGNLNTLNANIVGSVVDVIAVQPDGKTIIAGNFSSVLGVPRSNIARLNADGTLDTGFDPKPNSYVLSVAVQADGKVLLGGAFTTLQPNGTATAIAREYVARVNSDGTLDTGFDPKASYHVECVAVQPDGKVLLGGGFHTLQPNGAPMATAREHIARVNADGTLDTGFDPKANDDVYTISIQTDGKVLFGGYFISLQPNGATTVTARQYIARVNANGTLDMTFDPKPNTYGYVHSVSVQADGKVLLGGDFVSLQPNGAAVATQRIGIARVNADGSLDIGFDPKASNSVHGLAVQADGKVLLCGAFSTLQPNGATTATPRERIARVNADGTLDTAFYLNTNGSVYASANNSVYNVALQADGKVLLCGSLTIPRNLFARLQNDAATQTLSAPSPTQVLWTRGGATPEVGQVTFELSTNGGITWSPLGAGMRVGTTANWQLTGQNLPASGQLRARGRLAGGFLNGNSGLVEQVAAFPDTITLTPTLTSTAANTVTKSPVSVAFTLPEAAANGTVRLTFTGAVTRLLTLANTQGTAGEHTFTLNPSNPTGSSEIASGTAIPDGLYTVTLSYQDALSNPSASASSTNVRLDTTAPTLTLPNFITAEATSPAGAGVSYIANASDSGSGLATSSFLPASGSTFPITTTSVNVTATDNAGNTATGSFTVTVADTTAPVVAVHANVGPIAATSSAGEVVTYDAATATDAVGVASVVYSQASGTTFPIGITTAYKSSDIRGNYAMFVHAKERCSQPITFPA